MSDKPEKFIDENGLRLDGRQIDEMRPMKIEIGVLPRADGSCYLEWGKNKVMAAVYGPRELHPRRMQKADSVLIRYRYNMAAFSVEDRIRPGPNRRSIEISKVSREAFEPVVLTQLYPGAVIDVFAEVLQADAGTRTAAINAASLALADAGIPMKGLVAACAVGKVDGQLVLDLNKAEDNFGDADFPMAMTQDGEVSLVQMDGNFTQDEFKRAVELCKKGCQQILEMQKEALRGKFANDSLFDVTDVVAEDSETEALAEADDAAPVEDVVEVSSEDEIVEVVSGDEIAEVVSEDEVSSEDEPEPEFEDDSDVEPIIEPDIEAAQEELDNDQEDDSAYSAKEPEEESKPEGEIA
jgi:exosome complex component RRP41